MAFDLNEMLANVATENSAAALAIKEAATSSAQIRQTAVDQLLASPSSVAMGKEIETIGKERDKLAAIRDGFLGSLTEDTNAKLGLARSTAQVVKLAQSELQSQAVILATQRQLNNLQAASELKSQQRNSIAEANFFGAPLAAFVPGVQKSIAALDAQNAQLKQDAELISQLQKGYQTNLDQLTAQKLALDPTGLLAQEAAIKLNDANIRLQQYDGALKIAQQTAGFYTKQFELINKPQLEAKFLAADEAFRAALEGTKYTAGKANAALTAKIQINDQIARERILVAQDKREAKAAELQAEIVSQQNYAELTKRLSNLQITDIDKTNNKDVGEFGGLNASTAKEISAYFSGITSKTLLPQALGDFNKKLKELNKSAGTSAGQLEILAPKLEEFAAKNGYSSIYLKSILGDEKKAKAPALLALRGAIASGSPLSNEEKLSIALAVRAAGDFGSPASQAVAKLEGYATELTGGQKDAQLQPAKLFALSNVLANNTLTYTGGASAGARSLAVTDVSNKQLDASFGAIAGKLPNPSAAYIVNTNNPYNVDFVKVISSAGVREGSLEEEIVRRADGQINNVYKLAEVISAAGNKNGAQLGFNNNLLNYYGITQEQFKADAAGAIRDKLLTLYTGLVQSAVAQVNEANSGIGLPPITKVEVVESALKFADNSGVFTSTSLRPGSAAKVDLLSPGQVDLFKKRALILQKEQAKSAPAATGN